MSMPASIVWLRRDLRLNDHAALYHALQKNGPVQPVFIFDSEILAHFPNTDDRRLSFLMATLCDIDSQLQKRGGSLLVLHGKASELIPKLTAILGSNHVFAAEDYEPAAIARDRHVAQQLQGRAHFIKDQVIFSPDEILLQNGNAYKVFTPYSHNWKSHLTPFSTAPYAYSDHGRYANSEVVRKKLHGHGVTLMDLAAGPAAALKTIGYAYREDTLWPVTDAQKRLVHFIKSKAQAYDTQRDFMAIDGTSRLSPYLRFGLVSVRECAGAALETRADKWLGELIWREFYAMTLAHAPESAISEWNPKYRGRLRWSDNESHFAAWTQGKTGYPLVDAAMRQLLSEGWMHNRARMVVASFLTKHLRLSWRLGEAHFGQYLMDYDLASNVGGWQWAASTGTDAQPYFRVFNPTTQSEKFDPDGTYIRRYVPELKGVDKSVIHAPWNHPLLVQYHPPIVDHAQAREQAIAMFKQLA